MPQKPDEIRTEIERTREEIADSLAALRNTMTDATDWRAWVRRRPLGALAGAFILGVVLGTR